MKSNENKRGRNDVNSQESGVKRQKRRSTNASIRLTVSDNTVQFSALSEGAAVPVEASLNEGSSMDLKLEVGQEISVKTADGTVYRFRVDPKDSHRGVIELVSSDNEHVQRDSGSGGEQASNDRMVDLIVKGENSLVIEVQARPSDDVSVLKAQIQDALDVHPDRQSIYSGNRLCLQHERLGDLGITEESTLRLSILPEYMIFVKLSSGRTLTLHDIRPSNARVSDIKLRIQEKEGIVPKEMRLLFDGQYLDDRRILSDYGIQNDSTLTLVLLQYGN
eukprot:280822_1